VRDVEPVELVARPASTPPATMIRSAASTRTERTIAGNGNAIDAVRPILRREDWMLSQSPDFTVRGLTSCVDLFGL
jgi:hypothetical protein